MSLTYEPLIIAGAGLLENHVDNEMTEMVDLVPLAFQICGIDESFAHCGLSFISRLLPRDSVTSQILRKEYAFTEGGFLMSEEPFLEQSPYPYDIPFV